MKELIEELGLDADPNDLESIRKGIRAERAAIHPDKTGGEFASQQAKRRYQTLDEGLKYVDASRNAAHGLVQLSQLPEIIQVLRSLQTPHLQADIAQLRNECRDDERKFLHSRYMLPRLSSGIIAAVCGFLFTFSGQMKDHPLLGGLATSPGFTGFLLVFGMPSLMLFLATWFRERMEEAFVDSLLTDSGLRGSFKRFLQDRADDSKAITICDYAEFLQDASQSSSLAPYPLARSLRSSVCEKIARLHLLTLESRGAVKQLETPSVDLEYEVNERVLDNMRRH
jgi:hypothetical protein